MKKGILLALLLGVVLVVGSIGFAADNHSVAVTINPFVRISVTGTASGTVEATDFSDTGAATKVLTSSVDLTVKTNNSTGCTVSALAPNFTSGTLSFAIGKLSLAVGSQSAVSLATTSKQIASFSDKQNNTYDVAFTIALDGTETASEDAYTTTVTYTAAVID